MIYLSLNPEIEKEVLENIIEVVGWNGKPVGSNRAYHKTTILNPIADIRGLRKAGQGVGCILGSA